MPPDRHVRRLAAHAGTGGTFVELELGMLPRRLGDRLFDRTLGKPYFRRWAGESIDGLRKALGCG